MQNPEPEHDLFISHASEDKEAFVRPLARRLREVGLRVWYDEFSLRLGDSLRRSIERGLADSPYGVVVLSPHFFAKEWPQTELNGLFARELTGDRVILPIWHDLTKEDVLRYAPMLADKVAGRTSEGLDAVVDKILAVVQPRPPVGEFDKEKFRLPSTGFLESSFELHAGRAGLEARAVLGAMTRGDGLLVRFQDQELGETGLRVWLTVENAGGDRAYRWFGPLLNAYASPINEELQPELHEEIGGHLIQDIYPGEQFTFYYAFNFPHNVRAKKLLICRSWDKDMTFWWARGA